MVRTSATTPTLSSNALSGRLGRLSAACHTSTTPRGAEKTDKAYDLTIAAASLLGGFTIKEVLAAPTVENFSQATPLYHALATRCTPRPLCTLAAAGPPRHCSAPELMRS